MAYSTELQVRKVLPTLLIDYDFLNVVDSGTLLTLSKVTIDVPTITKNGATLTKDTDFTFKEPYTVTLGIAGDGEEFIALCYHGAYDADVAALISTADRIIDDFFYQYDSPATEYKADWSKWIAASLFLKYYAAATEENLSKSDALNTLAYDAMEKYKNNTLYNTPTAVNTIHDYVVKVN